MHELLGSAVAERLVVTESVVVIAPIPDDEARVSEGSELVLVEAFVAEATVERFDIRILRWLARIDEVQAYFPIASPARHRDSSQLGSVINNDRLADDNYLGESATTILAG